MPILSAQKPMSRRSAVLPWIVFAVTVGLTVAAWWLTRREVRRTTQISFERLAERMQGTLRRRFDSAALLLQGAAAFPIASSRVTAAEWSVYLRRVSAELGDGVVGLGFAERVSRTDLDLLEARLRRDGETDFKIQRSGTNEWLYVVLAIEPREHNTGVLGLDIGSGTTRKEAAEAAAAENKLILSRRIRINFDGKDTPGFLLFLPVYQRGADLSTREARIAAVQGWVYASMRIDQLMLGVAESAAQQIDFDVFEGEETHLDNLLYNVSGRLHGASGRLVTADDYSARSLTMAQGLEIYGRRWSLWLSTRPEFARANFNSLPAWVLGVGLTFSVLVTILTWALVNSRRQAILLARDMTADLRRMALVASHTGNGVFLTDAEWRVEWINRGFTELLGFTLEEVKGRKPVSFLTGPDSDQKTLVAVDEAAQERRRFTGEVLAYTKDGRKIWIELEIQPVVNENGSLEGFMGLQVDITERKRQSEKMRVAMETAEKANEAKSQFLAMMSHEIRTPMNGVIGMTSLLLDTPLNPEQRESAEIIRQSGESLLTIINDVLDFSKVESDRLELEQSEFALAECVEGAMDLLAGAAAKKNIELLYEIADELPAMVIGDAVRLRQVLVNLLGNAVKFTLTGEVAVTVTMVARQESTVEVLFQVRDTGIGISAEGMERLFKPFSQVDASMTRKFGGTGLGLVISRRLVELMGGSISAKSETGCGSVFSFSLRLPVVADGASIPPGAPDRLRQRRVLLVEANASVRRILVERMAKWGMVSTEVATPALALEHLRGPEKIDALVVDLNLPEMDGRALALATLDLPARSKLPFILLSTQGRRENSDGLFDVVLAKPVKATQLFDAFVKIFWPSRGAASTAPIKSTPPQPIPLEPTRALFVEEKRENHAALVELFEQVNCRVDAVCSRDEVLEALRRQSYAVVFLDLSTSLSDGQETARQVRRSLPRTADIWLVALADELRPGAREACRDAGINDYLSRPFTQAQLAAALERAKWRLPG